jgi:hypothetical protein
MASRKGGYRSYVDVDAITKLVGTHTCAALVQHYTRVGPTRRWREGAKVRGHKTIKRGTAVATFVDGKYPNKASGNHAALYVKQDATGIYVVDQWEGYEEPITSRRMRFKGKRPDGSYKDPSNNGDALSIIELT